MHGISLSDSALLGERHLAAGVGHLARGLGCCERLGVPGVHRNAKLSRQDEEHDSMGSESVAGISMPGQQQPRQRANVLGIQSPTRPCHDVACMGLPVHSDSLGQDSEVLALRLPGRRSATGLEVGAVIVAISACSQAQCHASSESDCRHKPFKTRFDAIAK